jgi:phosphopantothenoylcysteine decarboxylase
MTEKPRKAQRKLRVLWGCTGSIATVKVPKACAELISKGFDVRVVTTAYGKRMLLGGAAERYDASAFVTMAGVEILEDKDEWPADYSVGKDPVLHIELRRWADVFVIAPLSANTLAKLANGLCDNLLTCIARAWDPAKPMIVAPAMNTLMWDHPFTAKHLEALNTLTYIKVIPPIVKTLACNDTGNGAMAQVSKIISAIDALVEPDASPKEDDST